MPRHDSLVEKPFFTVKEVADRWRCSEKKVRRVIAKGELIVHRFGGQVRVSTADLLTYERLHRMA